MEPEEEVCTMDSEAEAGAERRRAGYFIFLVGGGNAGVVATAL
jgi:hypothetical protein